MKTINEQLNEVFRVAGVQLNESTDWSVKEAVQKIASEKGISNHDAMIEYSKRAGMDWGEVYDLCMFGDEHLSLGNLFNIVKKLSKLYGKWALFPSLQNR